METPCPVNGPSERQRRPYQQAVADQCSRPQRFAQSKAAAIDLIPTQVAIQHHGEERSQQSTGGDGGEAQSDPE
jgi:hypothetical protein